MCQRTFPNGPPLSGRLGRLTTLRHSLGGGESVTLRQSRTESLEGRNADAASIPVAVVTGANRGSGLEVCRQPAGLGHRRGASEHERCGRADEDEGCAGNHEAG